MVNNKSSESASISNCCSPSVTASSNSSASSEKNVTLRTAPVPPVETSKPNCPLCPDPTSQTRVFVKLFLHSVAMFTLPFLSYFFAKRVAMEEFDMPFEQAYIYGAIAAVITVNIVIGSYVYQALTEDDNKKEDDHLHSQ